VSHLSTLSVCLSFFLSFSIGFDSCPRLTSLWDSPYRMLGQLEPTVGQVHLNSGARVALVNQHHADQIDLNKTPLDYLRSQFKGAQRHPFFDPFLKPNPSITHSAHPEWLLNR